MNRTRQYWVDLLKEVPTDERVSAAIDYLCAQTIITAGGIINQEQLEDVRADIEATLGTQNDALIGDISGVIKDDNGTISVSLEGVFTVSQLATIIAVATRRTP